MKKLILMAFTCFLLAIATISQAQDLNFSQFYELPLMRNPALAGIFTGDVRVQTAYRNQWQSVTVPYQTQALSVEVKFPVGHYSDFLTLGAQITNDVAGDSKLHRIQFLPVLNYHKSLGDEDDIFLSAAFMGGFVSSQFDPTQLRWGDQFVNGSYSPNNPTSQVLKSTGRTYLDGAAGLSLNAPVGTDGRWYIGAGIFHFNKPNVAYNSAKPVALEPKYAFNIGLTTPTSDVNQLTLYGDVFLQGGHNQFLMGAIYTQDVVQYEDDDKISVGVGAFYRWDDAIAPVIKLDYHHWGVGLSYDVNVSKLVTASESRGGFEFTLNYKNFLNSRIIDSYKMKCPRF